MYHDSGVGNSRSIRNADTYSMAWYQRPHPASPPCRIVARGNRISREQPPKQRRPKIAGVYVARCGRRVAAAIERGGERRGGRREKEGAARYKESEEMLLAASRKVAENRADGERVKDTKR